MTIISLGIDPLVGIEINHTIEAEEITIGTIVGPIIEVDQEKTIDITIGEATIDMMIEEIVTGRMIGKTIIDKINHGTITETITDQIMEETINRDIEIEVKVGRILEIIIETIQEKDLREVEIGVEIDKHDQDVLEHIHQPHISNHTD